MKNDKKTQRARQRPARTSAPAKVKAKVKAKVTAKIRLASSKSAAASSASAKAAVGSTASATSGRGAEHLVARSIFGHAPEIHRPRLVMFVGTSTNPYAPVAALWFGALAAESKATIVLAYPDDASPLAPQMMAALSENGIDTRRLIPRTLTPGLLAAADLVVTLSTGRQSRVKLPSTTRRREHWTITDPTVASAKARAQVMRKGTGAGTSQSARTRATAINRDALLDARSIRDALRARVAMLVFSEGWGRPEISREDARVTRAKPVVRPAGPVAAGPFGGQTDGMAFSFIAEASPAWFATPSLSPPSLR